MRTLSEIAIHLIEKYKSEENIKIEYTPDNLYVWTYDASRAYHVNIMKHKIEIDGEIEQFIKNVEELLGTQDEH